MKLYRHPISIMPWRVAIALHEKGLPFDEIDVDVHSSPQRTPEFLRLNPFGQIPVIEDDGLVVAESIAILEYLEERHPHPALMPSAPAERAIVRQLMCWSTDYWPPAWKKWMAPRLPGGEWTDESVREGRRQIAAHLDVLEPYVAARDWLAGANSLADVCYAPLVLVLEHVGLAGEITGRPGVSRWADRLRARPAFRAAMKLPGV
jgi:glutathione S-transferase